MTHKKGFTLIELMITIAIIGILAAVAIPSYVGYTNRARFAEVVQTSNSLKSSVAACVQNHNGTLTDCDSGTNGIPASTTHSNIASLSVTDAVITATGDSTAGAYTYILTPAYSNNITTWTVAGTCVAAGVCNN